MANQEIHNYVDEQITPNNTDYLDLDADQGGGNFLSKKLTFANLRNWLFKLVSQNLTEQNYVSQPTVNPNLGEYQALELNITGTNSEITPRNQTGPGIEGIYGSHATFIYHINNVNGGTITLSNDFITAPDNPDITTTAGGYAQVWVTYRRKSSVEYWTANTINFI